MTDQIGELKAEEQSRIGRGKRRDSNWLWGTLLIVVGITLLVSNVTAFHFNNWWALIVLALGARGLAQAWRQRQVSGAWTSRSRSALIWGAIVTLAGLIFLFGWSWATLWPIVIIIIGVGSLLTTDSAN